MEVKELAKMTAGAIKAAVRSIGIAKQQLDAAASYKDLMEEMAAPADQMAVAERIHGLVVEAYDALTEAEAKLSI